MTIPASLAAALLAPIPTFATDEGAVLLAPLGALELRRVCRGVWQWTGIEPDRRLLVREGRA